MRFPVIALLASALAFAPVVSAQGADKPADSASAKPAKGGKNDSNTISADEIANAKLPTAYDLVDRLRRKWLRPDVVTGGDVVVYMDEQNLGAPAALRDLPSVNVEELQYLSNAEAVRRWGSTLKGAVIVVTRKR